MSKKTPDRCSGMGLLKLQNGSKSGVFCMKMKGKKRGKVS